MDSGGGDTRDYITVELELEAGTLASGTLEVGTHWRSGHWEIGDTGGGDTGGGDTFELEITEENARATRLDWKLLRKTEGAHVWIGNC